MRLFKYYTLIIIPFVALFFALKFELVSSILFITLLSIYWFVYRTYLDAKKLIDQNVIEKHQWWRLLIPFRRVRYFKQ